MKAPWDHGDRLYPPPHPELLGLHFVTSVSKAMKASGDDHELDDDDNDEELAEPVEVRNERVQYGLTRRCHACSTLGWKIKRCLELSDVDVLL